MRRLIQISGIATLCLFAVIALYGLSAFLYNRHLVEYEIEVAGWPEAEAFSEPTVWQTDHPKRARILALEGGAMFGLAELEVLKALEEKSGKRIYEMFDFVAGASTGAIISTLLFYPDPKTGEPMTAAEAIDAYSRFGADVLETPLHHKILTGGGLFGPLIRNQGRIAVANELLGDGQFNDLLRPAMFPAFSQQSNGLTIFRNWDDVEGNMYLRSLVTGVTSAPIYFPAIVFSGAHADGHFISDPAMILNAPGEVAYLHARTHLPEAEEFVVVALGTVRNDSISGEIAEQGGLIQWFKPMLRMVFRGEASVSAHALERHSGFESTIDLQAFLLKPEEPADVNEFDPKSENIALIRKTGQQFVADNQTVLNKIVGILTAPTG
ncbi:patatin-like phospholipase family protein [Ruegeria sp. 2205SS24-7]|uniref:patatin-like phospholipase family protein n=1 Tax=Ruegeria discodermiae TaxID=3064389 RepID=UPI00274135BD|nr:patatin-like phospholipase family protein [Ruegeria sp. 2205SS24-7]MDP5219346.1 patatin-like phospholipase family protein [Ruegeria sp. 2205SS24-7]